MEGQKLALAQMGTPRDELLAGFPSKLKQIKPPGLKSIKQMELFQKWSKYIPIIYLTDPLYKVPSEEVQNEIKEKRRGSRKRRKEEAAQVTTTTDTEQKDAVENGLMSV